MKAYVLVQTRAGTGPIAGDLQTILGVTSADDLRGPYDAIATAGGVERPLEAILAEIRALPDVVRALFAPIAGSLGLSSDTEAA